MPDAESAPIVNPWKDPVAEITFFLPVESRASFIALSIASDPLLHKKREDNPSGEIAVKVAASSA